MNSKITLKDLKGFITTHIGYMIDTKNDIRSNEQLEIDYLDNLIDKFLKLYTSN